MLSSHCCHIACHKRNFSSKRQDVRCSCVRAHPMNTRLRFAFHVNGKRAGHLGAYGTTLTSGVVRHGTSNGQAADAQGLAAVLWALARDRRLATDGIDLNLVSSTCHEASLRLREMKPGHIVNIAWAIGILTHADAVFLPQAGGRPPSSYSTCKRRFTWITC